MGDDKTLRDVVWNAAGDVLSVADVFTTEVNDVLTEAIAAGVDAGLRHALADREQPPHRAAPEVAWEDVATQADPVEPEVPAIRAAIVQALQEYDRQRFGDAPDHDRELPPNEYREQPEVEALRRQVRELEEERDAWMHDCRAAGARVRELEGELADTKEGRREARINCTAAEDVLNEAAETLECTPDQVPEQVRRLADECRRATEAAEAARETALGCESEHQRLASMLRDEFARVTSERDEARSELARLKAAPATEAAESGCMPEVMAVVEACEAPGVTHVMKGLLYRTLVDLVEAVRSGKRCGSGLHPATVDLFEAARNYYETAPDASPRAALDRLRESADAWGEADCPDLPTGKEGGRVMGWIHDEIMAVLDLDPDDEAGADAILERVYQRGRVDCAEQAKVLYAEDAEVGRLLREAGERWPDDEVCLSRWDGYPEGKRYRARNEDVDVHGPTPAAALRALLGDEGGQHDAG